MLRFARSLEFALNGLRLCLLEEANFRIHIFCATAVVIAGFYFGITTVEWLWILACIGFVLCMEMINTAVENLCNLVHKEIHPVIKTIKDISAGAVLVSAIMAAVCGAVIFFPKIILLIKSINHEGI